MSARRQPPLIDAWGGGGFRVSGEWRPGSLLIFDGAVREWPPSRLAHLTPDDFADILAGGPAVSEFVLLGAGEIDALPPRTVRDVLRSAGLGFEFMSTEAAARVHNVLAAEGRRFATALIAV